MGYQYMIKGLLTCLLLLCFSLPATAAFTLYDKDGGTFSVDGSFNTYYVFSDSDKNAAMGGEDRQQSRVRMGFLPNWIGFNFSREVGSLKVGGRSSFWVTINDSDDLVGGTHGITDTGIDVRQFYGTVDAAWGQILIGKDFTLFSRSNIFLDEILLGYGTVNDTLGLIDGANVSFGNIGTGYIYPMPSPQITYRTPDLAGFKLAIGLVDPSRTTSGSGAEEELPRFEGELTYSHNFGTATITAWSGFLYQKSEDAADDITSTGISYGVQGKFAGVSLTASGFDASGVGLLLGPGTDTVLGIPIFEAGDEVDSNGYVLQASYTYGPSRIAISYGQNELDADPKWENETTIVAYFQTINDYLKLVAEYNINEISIGAAEEETETIALGAVLNF